MTKLDTSKENFPLMSQGKMLKYEFGLYMMQKFFRKFMKF